VRVLLRNYSELIYFGARRCCELLWFVTCATKAKVAGICGSSHDPGGFALLVELTTGTVRLTCKRPSPRCYALWRSIQYLVCW